MVKRKAEPVKGDKAGYAARTSPRVHDRTLEEESSESEAENQPTPTQSTAKPSQQKAATNLPLARRKSNQFEQPEIRSKSLNHKTNRKIFKEIAKLQRTTDLLIPRAPFLRLIRELIQKRTGVRAGMRVTEMAVEALREASECVLTSMFEDSYLLALHAKRVTLFPRDITLLLRLKHDSFLTNQN